MSSSNNQCRVFVTRAGKCVKLLASPLAVIAIVLCYRSFSTVKRVVPETGPSMIAVRATPLRIFASDDRSYIGDEIPSDMKFRLLTLMAPDRKTKSVSYLLHYLDFWGLRDHRMPTEIPSQHIVDAFLNNRRYDWMASSDPLFFTGPDELLRIANDSDSKGEAHPDQVLAILGGVGVPSSRKITYLDNNYCVADAVISSARNFVFDHEIEWSALAYLRYIPSRHQWTNRWGDIISFDRIAEHLVSRRHRYGPCSGTHALLVLVAMLRVNEQVPLLENDTVNKIRRYLRAASEMLRTSQNSTGFWSENWNMSGQPPVTGTNRIRELHITGHHLEWIYGAPVDLRPDDETVRRAVAGCIDRLASATVTDVRQNICAFAHPLRVILEQAK